MCTPGVARRRTRTLDSQPDSQFNNLAHASTPQRYNCYFQHSRPLLNTPRTHASFGLHQLLQLQADVGWRITPCLHAHRRERWGGTQHCQLSDAKGQVAQGRDEAHAILESERTTYHTVVTATTRKPKTSHLALQLKVVPLVDVSVTHGLQNRWA